MAYQNLDCGCAERAQYIVQCVERVWAAEIEGNYLQVQAAGSTLYINANKEQSRDIWHYALGMRQALSMFAKRKEVAEML